MTSYSVLANTGFIPHRPRPAYSFFSFFILSTRSWIVARRSFCSAFSSPSPSTKASDVKPIINQTLQFWRRAHQTNTWGRPPGAGGRGAGGGGLEAAGSGRGAGGGGRVTETMA